MKINCMLLLVVSVMFCLLLQSCDEHNQINVVDLQLKSIEYSVNPCDSIEALEIILHKPLDATNLENISRIICSCGESRRCVNSILAQQLRIVSYELSSEQLIRLVEAYRELNYTDSALHYLSLFEEITIDPIWNKGRVALWRMQILFEGKRYYESIAQSEIAISSGFDTTSFRKELPSEYIAYSYLNLGMFPEYCEYSRVFAPRVFSEQICDSISEIRD